MSDHLLTPSFIASQKARLEALRAEILGSEGAALSEVKRTQEDTGEEAAEYEDVAQALDRKEILQARHDVDQVRLASIDRALKKIEAGTYGLSDVSGKPISIDRLKATPEATATAQETAAKER